MKSQRTNKPAHCLSATFSRRSFLARSGIIASGVAVLPGYVLGLNGATPPSGKLNIAGIGVGGQGARNLENMASENIVALCDVDRDRGAGSFRKYPKAKVYADYREMFEKEKEIDAVMVATPDHHHAPASMEAIKRGKPVYCEKPLTHSVWEARHVAREAQKAGVATQMGNSGQASDGPRRLCELIWSGAIGGVREAHVWTDRPSRGLFEEYWPQGLSRPTEKPVVPNGLEWDLWLGPAPERPYHRIYVPFSWRGWWDFGTGALGDIGCHAMDPVFRALKLGAPVSVQGCSTRVNTETFPLGSMVTWQFPGRPSGPQKINTYIDGISLPASAEAPMPPCKVVWYDGGLRPPRPEGLPQGVLMGDNGRLIIGEKGFILGDRLFSESGEAAQRQRFIPSSPGHYREWIDACKGGKAAGSNFNWAGPLAEAVLLGNVALRTQMREDLTLCRLEWDAENLRFTNLEEANRFLKRDYRPGWTL
jgi:predicted dehydrogenase